jgi:rubredoxin
MKSFRDYEPTLECDTCGYTLHGDMPQIVITCDNCIAEKEMFENMNTKERLEEVVMWIIEDLWNELTQSSKTRVIRQLRFMGYSVDDLEEIKDE